MGESREEETQGERREERRRRARKMRVSGKGFVNAVRNAISKRLREGGEGKGKKRGR